MQSTPLMLGAAGAALVIVIIVIVWLVGRRRRAAARAHEEAVMAAIAAKAAAEHERLQQDAAGQTGAGTEVDPDLSESGVLAIHKLVEQLAEGGDLKSAEKWALTALEADPRRLDVAVQLAGIYHRMGRPAQFFAVLDRHVIARRDELSAEQQAGLERMVEEMSSR